MAEAPEPTSVPTSPLPLQHQQQARPWRSYLQADYLNQTVLESKDFVFRSAPSVKEGLLSSPIRKTQELLPELKSHYKAYEDVFFKKVKDGLKTAYDHPNMTCGVALAASLLLMRGPRRFLFHQTIGRFQTEEALLSKAEKRLTDLDQAVQLTRNETKKLLDRAGYAENAMLGAKTRLSDSAKQIQWLVGDLYKAESKATDFMDELRQLPGRDALKLRAEVASMMADMRQQRKQMKKRITRISELGIRV